MTDRSVGYSAEGSAPLVREVEITTTKRRVVGGRIYTTLDGATPGHPVWIRFPGGQSNDRGLVGTLVALDAFGLGLLDAPNQAVTLLASGTTTLGSVSVSAYWVELTDRQAACAAGIPLDRSGRPNVDTEIWVDRQGRLRQVRTRMTVTLPAAHGRAQGIFQRKFSGAEVLETTLKLGSFGQPVHVVAPPVGVQHGTSSTFEAIANCARQSHR